MPQGDCIRNRSAAAKAIPSPACTGAGCSGGARNPEIPGVGQLCIGKAPWIPTPAFAGVTFFRGKDGCSGQE